MKSCSKCGEPKPSSEFGLRKRSADGLQSWCRDCLREYQRDYARNHRDPARHREAQQRYRTRNRQKLAAHQAVRHAVRACEIVVPVWCQSCRCVTELEAHHHDYRKPLEVKWLCTTCHGHVHRSYRESPLA